MVCCKSTFRLVARALVMQPNYLPLLLMLLIRGISAFAQTLKIKMLIQYNGHRKHSCLSPVELCQYILAKGVRKHGSEALF